MRTYPLLLAAVVVAPAAAQTKAIAPAPSPLFAPSTSAPARRPTAVDDTAFHQNARSVGTGFGVLLGASATYVLSKVKRSQCATAPGDTGCSTDWSPGVGGYALGMTLGGLAGFLVGTAIHTGTPPE